MHIYLNTYWSRYLQCYARFYQVIAVTSAPVSSLKEISMSFTVMVVNHAFSCPPDTVSKNVVSMKEVESYSVVTAETSFE